MDGGGVATPQNFKGVGVDMSSIPDFERFFSISAHIMLF